MGRGKVELKRIENKVSRQVTFSKRRGGLLKKAHELAVLCDAQVGVIVFSSNGRLFEYCGPDCSLRELIHRYETTTNQMLQDANHNNQQMLEISELRHESEHLEARLRKQVGEDLASIASMDELNSLEQQLETALGKVKERKYELLHQQLNDSHQKVHVLEDQNCYLQLIVDGSGHRPAAATEGMPPMLPATAFTHLFFPEEQASTSLQLWPQLPDPEGTTGKRPFAEGTNLC